MKKNTKTTFVGIDNRASIKKELSFAEMWLLSYITHMKDMNKEFYASNEYISSIAPISQSSISRYLKKFEDKGWLSLQFSPGGREITISDEERENLEKYLGTQADYKKEHQDIKDRMKSKKDITKTQKKLPKVSPEVNELIDNTNKLQTQN